MKLSTKGRYGVRLMLELAMHYGEGPVLLKKISRAQGISEKYLWHLITPLKNSGLITALRGAKGGYALAKNPSKISLSDIVIPLEGRLSVTDCVEDASICARSSYCASRDVWSDISRQINTLLKGISLKDLVERQKGKHEKYDYHI